jgi:hypothetical protein
VRSHSQASGAAAAAWALSGIAVLFLFAAYRLGSSGLATVRAGLAIGEWAALIVLTVLFVYGEGRRALQQRWVPRVILRASDLRRQQVVLYRLLAPLYGLSLIGASPRNVVRAWALSAAILGAVLVVRMLCAMLPADAQSSQTRSSIPK